MLVSTLYPQPMALAHAMRYAEGRGVTDLDRQYEGGCGFSDRDATWANRDVLGLINRTVMEAAAGARRAQPNLRIVHMDSTSAFKGRNLCHKYVKRVNDDDEFDEGGPKLWREKTAVDRSESVVDVELLNASDTMQQESVHPNYWGSWPCATVCGRCGIKATPRGGTCTRSRGLTRFSEPHMSLKTA